MLTSDPWQTSANRVPICLGAIIFLLDLVPITSAVQYPFGFFNSSNAGYALNGVGFKQVLVCSQTPTYIEMRFNRSENNVKDYMKNLQFNKTLDNSLLTLTGDKVEGRVTEFPYGVKVLSVDGVFLYGVKSDISSSDGFLIPRLTAKSTEFYIAGWKSMYDSGILISSAYPDTCVEIYRITDGTRYHRVWSIYLNNDMMISQVVANISDDSTGLYVNSSKPIGVFASVSCGQVPDDRVGSCDYMAEQILPVSELGTEHVVPPIAGRSNMAGYLVRVVATEPDTEVTWSRTDLATPSNYNHTQNLTRAEYLQINVSMTTLPLWINCSRRCVVMQYNKGRIMVNNVFTENEATDAFMMLTLPTNHSVNWSCFATANSAMRRTERGIDLGYTVENFNNYLSIVTRFEHKHDIMLDNFTSDSFAWTDFNGFSVTTINIPHGWHSLYTKPGANPSTEFAAYVYGHSIGGNTAYGYPVGYEVSSPTLVDDYHPPPYVERPLNFTNGSCAMTEVASGDAVLRTADGRDARGVVHYPIYLDGTVVESPQFAPSCLKKYKSALEQQLKRTFADINYKICSRQLCADLQDTNNTGVLINSGDVTAGIPHTEVFVAVNMTSLSGMITLDLTNRNVITGVRIEVPLAGVYNTNIELFGKCRAELSHHLTSFENWFLTGQANNLTAEQSSLLSAKQFVATPGVGCSNVVFKDTNFVLSSSGCPTVL